MVRLKARYDGQVIVPDSPVDLPTGISLDVTIRIGEDSPGDNSILALEGLGSEVWEGVDAVEYQHGERAGWE